MQRPTTATSSLSWWTGAGQTAQIVARCPAVQVVLLRELAGELTRLSEECWEVYVEPVTTPDPFSGEVDGRRDLDGLWSLVANPELPHADGYVVSSYIPVVEAANRVGRLLHRISDAELVAAVRVDVETEAKAVLSADVGDFTARGRQAVRLSRVEASPAQVQTAWQTLAADPLDGTALLVDYDPAAASVAAAAWLQAAADLAAEESGRGDGIEVIQFADDLEAVPVETLSIVLNMLGEHGPYNVVAHLISEARIVASGRAPDVYRLEQAIHDARSLAGRIAQQESDVDALLGDVRLCVLDPARPAPDLLEDLLTGIYACWLVWDEHVSQADSDTLDVDDETDEDLDPEGKPRAANCSAQRCACA